MSTDDQYKAEGEYWRNYPRRRPQKIATPGPGQESVWDYPRPPVVQVVLKRIRVELGGDIVADTERALRVIETSSPPVYYIPPADVRMEWLTPTEKETFCEWKGVARYWTAIVAARPRPPRRVPRPSTSGTGWRGRQSVTTSSRRGWVTQCIHDWVTRGAGQAPNGAWSYPQPQAGFEAIRDYL